jgi:tetratricopeptide (TPR) repeat protein
MSQKSRIISWGVIFLMVLCFSVLSGTKTVAVISQINPPGIITQIEEGQRLFENGQYQEAIKVLQQTLTTLQKPEDRLAKATVLSNLALIYQQLGQWSQVDQATTESLNLLKTLDDSPSTLKVLASTLDLRGLWQLEIGQTEKAFTTWQESQKLYEQI